MYIYIYINIHITIETKNLNKTFKTEANCRARLKIHSTVKTAKST